jgi:hypothetical protein
MNVNKQLTLNPLIMKKLLLFTMLFLLAAVSVTAQTAAQSVKGQNVRQGALQPASVVGNIQLPSNAVSANDPNENNQQTEPPLYAPLAARTASVSGNWNNTATWGGAAVPTSADAVTINSGITVTVDIAGAQCASLTFAAINANSVLTISGTNSLAITGLLSMPRPATGYTGTVNVNAGTLTCGSLTMSATTSTRNDILNITTGSVTVSGTLTTGTTGCIFNITGAGTLNLGGTITGTPTLSIVATGTVNYTSASAQTLIPGTYGILNLTGAGTKTIGASKTIITNGTMTNSSTLVLTAGTSTTSTYLAPAGNFINNPGATLNGTAAYTTFYFIGTAAQTFTNDGTVTAPLYVLALGNSAGLTLLGANQVTCQRVNLYYGTLTNSNKITLGNGGTTYGVVQIGSSTTYAAGTFDQAPTFNAGTGGYQILYAPALNDYATSYEVPADGNVAYMLVVCTPKTVSLSRDITIPYVYTTGLNLSSGNLNIGAHTLTVNGTVGISAATVTGGISSNITMSGTITTSLPAVAGGLNNLTIDNAAGIALNGAITVNGTLALTNGILSNGANLTMANGSTILRSGGSLASDPTFAGTVNVTYAGGGSMFTGEELPTSPTVLNNLTSGATSVTQYAYSVATTNLLTDLFPNLTSWSGNIGSASLQFNTYSSVYAGGTLPEAGFYSAEMNHANATYAINRGPINTSGYSAVNVSFKFMSTGNYTQSYPTYLKLQSATSSTGPWHDIWSVAYTAFAAQTVSVSNYTTDIGGNVYLQFAFVGDAYALDYWYFDNLVVDGVAITPIPSNVTVNGNLNVTSGTFTIGATDALTVNGSTTLTGNLRVLSGGSLITNGTVSGNATVERVINGDMKWHFLSSPVSGQSICDGVFAPTVTSFPGDPTKWDFYNYMPYCNLTTANIHWYNLRTTSGGVNSVDFPGLVFEDSRGYLVAYGEGFPTTKTFYGALNSGDRILGFAGITSPHCWALPGNPYPSAVDWSKVLGKDNLLYLYYYVWNDLTANFEYWMDSSHHSANVDGNIPAMQAFFVDFDPTKAETITIPNSARVHDNTTDLWLKDSPANQLTLTLNNSSSNNDMAVVMFEENSSTGRDRSDAEKLFSLNDKVPQIYTLTGDDLKSCLNSLPFVTDGITIPVGILAPADGEYFITVKGIESFSSLKGLSLEDLNENFTQNLLDNPTYRFSASKNEDASRFLLHFTGSVGIDGKDKNTVNIYSAGRTVYITCANGLKNAKVTVSNLLGQDILSQKLSDKTRNEITVNAIHGYYFVKVQDETSVKTAKVYIN